jgi:hypothetical protein
MKSGKAGHGCLPTVVRCVLTGRASLSKADRQVVRKRTGFHGGELAEWVALLPPRPAEGTGNFESLVGGSDHFGLRKNAFVKATADLISRGRSSESNFREIGACMNSANHGSSTYFTYCSGMRVWIRVYLNVSSGRMYR